MGSDAGWKVGGGGGGSRENLAIITKDFKKLSCFGKKWGECPVLISFHQTHFTFRLYFRCRSILQTLLPHLDLVPRVTRVQFPPEVYAMPMDSGWFEVLCAGVISQGKGMSREENITLGRI